MQFRFLPRGSKTLRSNGLVQRWYDGNWMFSYWSGRLGINMAIIRYRNGRKLQGILLSLGEHEARVAIKGADDAAIFRLISGVWVSEDCEVVTFEFTGTGEQPDRSTAREKILPAPCEIATLQRVM